jgi:hypothetical protein
MLENVTDMHTYMHTYLRTYIHTYTSHIQRVVHNVQVAFRYFLHARTHTVAVRIFVGPFCGQQLLIPVLLANIQISFNLKSTACALCCPRLPFSVISFVIDLAGIQPNRYRRLLNTIPDPLRLTSFSAVVQLMYRCYHLTSHQAFRTLRAILPSLRHLQTTR